jgi:RNA polymerase sigma-70 factor (ECF subfamily)
MAVMRPNQTAAELPGCGTIEELFAALESPLLGYAIRFVGQLSVAEDLVQEAFMRLHAQFDSVREPRPWLYRTVHNLALNHRRDLAKIVPMVPPAENSETGGSAEAADPLPGPDELAARAEGIDLVRLSLEILDDRSREVVRLKFNEDLSYQQIAAKTGLTVGNVGYLLHHALKNMGDELARNGVVR